MPPYSNDEPLILPPRFTDMLACALTLGAALLYPAQAIYALDLQAGIAAKYGVGMAYPDDEGALNDSLGFGGGGQVFLGARVLPVLGIGVNFDIGQYSSSLSDSATGTTRTVDDFSLLSAGLYLRLFGVDPKGGEAFQSGFGSTLWVNYLFGSISREDKPIPITTKSDYVGTQVGVTATFQGTLPDDGLFPGDVGMEFGLYAAYNIAKVKGQVAGQSVEAGTDSLQFGALFQLNYELTLF
jgi:hypothetical protein